MKRLEVGVGLFKLLLLGFVVASTAGLSYWQDGTPGPRFFPIWVAAVGGIAALHLIYMAWADTREREVDWPDMSGAIRGILIYVFLWGVVLLAPYIGFITAAGLFSLFFLIPLMRVRLLPSLLTTVVIVTLLHVLFIRLLELQLPIGPLGF
ncbi:hypothetical protein ABID21_004523 [Pseudorhizobium tarimense]|uniref:DUF1468 domain-containing protein n=1 Tax=Pseudorhizobium tarimense TaxID=1079109 RepID=A0ABV2HCX0_9HYPH|nr:tripartite tricarboxylate transporter TctB family protein [Pseudorhizobium tarimense]MCJ8521435.1 tripartite tricarboxylate transporter TctB family protein [Pseudorhizobium tarimense]